MKQTFKDTVATLVLVATLGFIALVVLSSLIQYAGVAAELAR